MYQISETNFNSYDAQCTQTKVSQGQVQYMFLQDTLLPLDCPPLIAYVLKKNCWGSSTQKVHIALETSSDPTL